MKKCSFLFSLAPLAFGFLGAAAADPAPVEVPMSKVVILSCPTSSPTDFKKLVAVAREIGAADVDVSALPKDRWQWFDPADPYPNWSMRGAGILKVIVPSELRPEIPTDIAEQSQKILAARGEILRENQLHAFFHAANRCGCRSRSTPASPLARPQPPAFQAFAWQVVGRAPGQAKRPAGWGLAAQALLLDQRHRPPLGRRAYHFFAVTAFRMSICTTWSATIPLQAADFLRHGPHRAHVAYPPGHLRQRPRSASGHRRVFRSME